MSNLKFNSFVNQVSEEIPAYRQSIFSCIIMGMVCSSSNKCIASIWDRFTCLFCDTNITLKRFYTFLGTTNISWVRIRLKLISMMGKEALTEGKLLIAIDDSNYGKSGKKIEGAATHFDHAAKQNSSSYLWGHCRVVTGVVCMIKNRWAFLPLLQDNYVPKKQNNGKGLTKIDIAIKHIKQMSEDFTEEILVACDSWFAVKKLVRFVKDQKRSEVINVLSRLRINSALFQLPEVGTKKASRGRPKKYGKRIESVLSLGTSLQADTKTAMLNIYSKKREVKYAETIVMSQVLKVKIKVIFVYRKNGRIFPIFTTDINLSAEQAIEYYAARWKIEAGFKELKHELGIIDNQCRKKNAVENHFNMGCTAMTLVWIYTMKLDEAPDRRIPNAKHFSFADVRAKIEQELMAEATNFNKFCPVSFKHAGKYILGKILARCA